MELRQLELFVAVADHLHFGHAAKACNIAQSALSQHIMRLERSLGVKLFERTSRKVELTSSGRTLLVEARHMLAASRQAAERARRAAYSGGNQFVVGVCGFCPPDVAISIVSDHQRRNVGSVSRARYLQISTAHEMWQRGEIDAVLTFVKFDMLGAVAGVELREEHRELVVPLDHPLAQHGEIELEKLGGEVLVGLPGCVTAAAAETWSPATTPGGRRIRHTGTAEFVEDIAAVAATGQALGVIPAWASDYVRRFSDVTTITLRAEPAKLFAFWRRESDDEQVRQFAECCVSGQREHAVSAPSP